MRNLPIEQTQEGIFLDVSLTESWEGLRQTIDQLLADDYDEIYDTQITFEGPWIIW